MAAWGDTETGWLGAGETRKESITAASTGGRKEAEVGTSCRTTAAEIRSGEPFGSEVGAPPIAGATVGASTRAAEASGCESKDGLAVKDVSLGTATTATSVRAAGLLPLPGPSPKASGDKGSAAEVETFVRASREPKLSAPPVAARSTASCVGAAEREDAAPCPALTGVSSAATLWSDTGASASGISTATVDV